MSEAPPQIRALTSHVALARIDTMAPVLRTRILAEAGDVSRARDAFQFGWIPFEVQIGILDAMRRNLSPGEWTASQRELMMGYLDKPVLRGLFDTAVRMFGLSVRSLAKWAPRAYDALFKHAGELRYEAGETEGELSLVLDGFPSQLFGSGSFAESLQAAFETIFVLTKTAGTVTMSDRSTARGHARYTLRWSTTP